MTPAAKNPKPSGKAAAKPKATAKPKAAAKPKATAKPKAAKKTKHSWDITGIEDWGASRHELGATIPASGNSELNITGGWRSQMPIIDSEKCNGCMLCYFYCPDASIIVEGGKATAVDLDHCKGCGICAKECPVDAIVMVHEDKE